CVARRTPHSSSFHAPTTPETYTLSLHDALPIYVAESDTQTVIGAVQEWIEKNEGSVTKVDYWGRRRLAYPINDFHEGYYVFLQIDRKSTRLNSSHVKISYAVFCLKKKKKKNIST